MKPILHLKRLSSIDPPTADIAGPPEPRPEKRALIWGIRGKKDAHYQYVVYFNKTWDVLKLEFDDWSFRLRDGLPALGKSIRPTDQEWVLAIYSIFARLGWPIPPEVAHAPDLDPYEVYGAKRPPPKHVPTGALHRAKKRKLSPLWLCQVGLVSKPA